MNTHNAHSLIPRLTNFIVDPLTTRGVCSYQNNGARLSLHLVSDPSRYGCVSAPFGQVLFLVEIIEAGGFNQQQSRLASPYRVSSPSPVRA